MHTELIILVSDCRSFLHKLTTSFRSELYTTVRQSGWKIHSSKVDTTQKQISAVSQPLAVVKKKKKICYVHVSREEYLSWGRRGERGVVSGGQKQKTPSAEPDYP